MFKLFKRKTKEKIYKNPYIDIEALSNKQFSKTITVLGKRGSQDIFDLCEKHNYKIVKTFFDIRYDVQTDLVYWLYSDDFKSMPQGFGYIPPIHKIIDGDLVRMEEFELVSYEDLLNHKSIIEESKRAKKTINEAQGNLDKTNAAINADINELVELEQQIVERKKELASLGVK